ncbi:MAG: hypothetical protein WA915_17660 [Candidatus Aminicenantaceae bacterium]
MIKTFTLRFLELVHRDGVQWTIKDGFVYHAPTMLEDVKNIVKQARSAE